MSRSKKSIQIKCVARCDSCGDEQGIASVIAHNFRDFPEYSYKSFYELADTDYEKFEILIKNSLECSCEKCGESMRIIDILDMQYIN